MKQIRRRVSEFLLVAVFVGIVYPERPLDNVRRFLRENEQQLPVKKYSLSLYLLLCHGSVSFAGKESVSVDKDESAEIQYSS